MQPHDRELSADSIDALSNMKSVSFDQPNPQLAHVREDLLILGKCIDQTDVPPMMKTCTSLCKSLREKLRIAHENENIYPAEPSIKLAKLLPTTNQRSVIQ